VPDSTGEASPLFNRWFVYQQQPEREALVESKVKKIRLLDH